jgi:hypothetical protein
VIINIHGGPEGQSRPASSAATTTSQRARRRDDLPERARLDRLRQDLPRLDNGMKREDSVKDIGALLDWIGRSPTSTLAGHGHRRQLRRLHDARRRDDVQRPHPRAAVDVVGISNFVTFLKNTESYRRDLRRVEYGDERDPKMRAFFDQIAPLNNAGKIAKPLFVVQGGNDPRVPLSEAEQMVERVKQNRKPVWYLMAKDEGHGFAKKANADFQFYATVMFVRHGKLDLDAEIQKYVPDYPKQKWPVTVRNLLTHTGGGQSRVGPRPRARDDEGGRGAHLEVPDSVRDGEPLRLPDERLQPSRRGHRERLGQVVRRLPSRESVSPPPG